MRLWHSPTFTTWGMFTSRFLGLLLVIPLIVTKFEVQDVACYFLFLSANFFLGVVEQSFSTTYIRFFAYAKGGADSIENISHSSHNSTGLNVQLLQKIHAASSRIRFISIGILSIMTLVGGSIFLKKPIGVSTDPSLIWQAWFLFAASAVIRSWAARDSAVMKGLGRIAEANRWDILFNCSSVLVVAIVLSLGGSLREIGVVLCFFSLAGVIRYRVLCSRIENGILNNYVLDKLDPKLFSQIWSPTWRQIFVISSSVGLVQASGLILAQLKEGTDLVSYLFALKLMEVASQISRAPFYSKIPIFSQLRGCKNLSELSLRTGKSIRFSLLTFLALVLSIIFVVPLYLQFQGSETQFVSGSIWVGLSLVWFFERHHAMHAQIVVTENKVPFVGSSVVTGMIHLLLMLLLTPKVGVWGLVVAHGVSNLVLNTWWIVGLSAKSLEGKFSLCFKQYAAPSFVALILTVLAIPIADTTAKKLGDLIFEYTDD